jgi:glycosyltransferase involved in cell wall biosynthesis
MGIRIGILGTRGIPNHYGGFERLAEKLSSGLVNRGHEVYVYNSHNHFYQHKKWNDVNIVHCYDPEYLLGTSGQFIYDLNCIVDARKRNFDVILMLGYTSSSVWGWLFPKKSALIYNMDGLEWKRAKYSKLTRKFLLSAERLAVHYSDFYITDSPVIKQYYSDKYKLDTKYIAYGATIFDTENEKVLQKYNISKKKYCLLVARMEPENNIRMILEGFSKTKVDKKFVVVGNMENTYGKQMLQLFSDDVRIHFAGAIFDEQELHSLCNFSSLYFHGHSTGGTNPSLLEAMASQALIAAHDNNFNKSVLQNDAFYFDSAEKITALINSSFDAAVSQKMVSNNLEKIKSDFNWGNIVSHYEQFMLYCLYRHIDERNFVYKRYPG